MKKIKSLLYIIPICLGLTLPLMASNKASSVNADNFNYISWTINHDLEVQNLGYTYDVSIEVSETSDLDSLSYPESVGYTIDYDADYIHYYGYEEYFYINLVNVKQNNTYVFYDNDYYFTFYPGDSYDDSYLVLSFNGISYNNDSFEFEEPSIKFIFDDADSDYNDIGNAYSMYSLAKLLIDDFDYSINDLFNSWFEDIVSITDTSYNYYQALNFPLGFYSHNYFNQPSDRIYSLESDLNDLQNQYDSLLSEFNELDYWYEYYLAEYNNQLDLYDMLENNYYDSLALIEDLESDLNELQNQFESLQSDYADLQNQYDSLLSSYNYLISSSVNVVDFVNYNLDVNHHLSDDSVVDISNMLYDDVRRFYYVNSPVVVNGEIYNYVGFDIYDLNRVSNVFALKDLSDYYNHFTDYIILGRSYGSSYYGKTISLRILDKTANLQLFNLVSSLGVSYTDNSELSVEFILNAISDNLRLTETINTLNDIIANKDSIIADKQALIEELNSKAAVSNTFDLLKTSFVSIVPLMEIELLPNITIGMLITIPFVVAIVSLLFRMLS